MMYFHRHSSGCIPDIDSSCSSMSTRDTLVLDSMVASTVPIQIQIQINHRGHHHQYYPRIESNRIESSQYLSCVLIDDNDLYCRRVQCRSAGLGRGLDQSAVGRQDRQLLSWRQRRRSRHHHCHLVGLCVGHCHARRSRRLAHLSHWSRELSCRWRRQHWRRYRWTWSRTRVVRQRSRNH